MLPTIEHIREVLDYDPWTGEFTWRARGPLRGWNTRYEGTKAGTVAAHGYLQIGLAGKLHRSHRLAWAHFYGEWPDSEIDHINEIGRASCRERVSSPV